MHGSYAPEYQLPYEYTSGGYYFYNVTEMPEIIILENQTSVSGQVDTAMVWDVQFVF